MTDTRTALLTSPPWKLGGWTIGRTEEATGWVWTITHDGAPNAGAYFRGYTLEDVLILASDWEESR